MPPLNPMARRAKDQLPAVLVTMLSIVQALALQLLWDYITAQTHLAALTWSAVLGWLQIATTLLGVLLVWLVYTSMTMRFRWVPTTADSIFPFVIGIVQYTMIGTLGLDRVGHWLVMLAIVYAVTAWASQHILRRARLDGENDAFFAHVPTATWRDFRPTVAIVGTLVATGAHLAWSRDQGGAALAALLFAFVAVAHQLWLNNRYWRRSMDIA